MSDVKRWKATERPGPGNVVEVVDYSDYAALEAENARLIAMLEDLEADANLIEKERDAARKGDHAFTCFKEIPKNGLQ